MIEPTLSWTDAARRTWDAIVIGAGPAGTVAARLLAQHRMAVLLVDRARFPRYKVCGGCLNPRTLRLLAQAGLPDLTASLGTVPLTRFRLATRRRIVEIPLPTGAGVSREAFDAALVRAAVEAGAHFLPDTVARCEEPDGTGRRSVRLRSADREQAIAGRLILAATGLGSRFETASPRASQPWAADSRIGAGIMLPPQSCATRPGTIEMACGRDGYVGRTVIEDGRIEMAAALNPDAVQRAGGLGPTAVGILQEAGLDVPDALAEAAWKGTSYLTRRPAALGGERLFVLGDAAGYIEPFTGEGIAWALAGALAVLPLALTTLHQGWHPDLLLRWQNAYRRNVQRRQWVCRLTAALLRRSSATSFLVRCLGTAPSLARPFLNAMYAP